ncbi:hypothetical protein [Algoriphagus pacificus]|uniref:DUF4062 domain-containing protein n=1 Tax=Algoriphagus pacificus TaxID=2811234 RepID=A0ABS3CGI2_9BACT|nr:hypothetical protein [Algoriphagus pacificus]MBN7815639.1 hypothetical protein [Algoriphagus pacificus]
MKTIRIFIASSSELKEDRDDFRLFISNQNDLLHKKGIYLELVQWEEFLDSISDSRLQDEYNQAIRSCDIVVCLFFTKVGKYTEEEFDTAYDVFKKQGRPKIWTYFKDAPVNTGTLSEEVNSLFAFKKKIGDLGHFYTSYTSIDNLVNKYRSQLDRYFADSETGGNTKSDGGTSEEKKEIPNRFNEVLTDQLVNAISNHNRRVKEFLSENPDWKENAHLIQTAKRLIINGYVGVIGVQIRKLMSIGEEDFSESKMKRYLENCQVTAKRTLQLICYALISSLWDHQLTKKAKLTTTQNEVLSKFFRNAAEEDILDLLELLKVLLEIYSENQFDFLISESFDLLPKIETNSEFYLACTNLHEVSALLKESNYSLDDCVKVELSLARVLEEMSFLAEYRMISINEIDFNQQRNDEEGLYLHNYVLLDGEIQFNTSQSKVRRENSPLISHAVILFKDNYRKNINLGPFIIDFNGMALTGGSKICFYSYCNTYDDMNLNFSFIEDNSRVVIRKSDNPKPEDSDLNALNKWLSMKENRKDMNFDKVYSLFYQAKKTLTGIEEESTEDQF